VTFEESYGPSGDQSRAVSAGLPADVVALALWPDVERLVEPGIVAPDWDENEYAGIIHDSVVSFAVRPGNPKAIHTWEDLARDDVVVITPNPITSGGAQWNILAAYQAQVLAGRTDEEAIDYLTRLAARVAVWDRGARDALTTFANGQGDVLLAYENEALFAQDSGVPLEVIVPDATILIENPIAATLTGDAPAQAQAFVDFVSTPDAQRVYARHHFRPVVPKVLAEFTFSAPPQLFTVADVGGWAEARPRFFDPDTGSWRGSSRRSGSAHDRSRRRSVGSPFGRPRELRRRGFLGPVSPRRTWASSSSSPSPPSCGKASRVASGRSWRPSPRHRPSPPSRSRSRCPRRGRHQRGHGHAHRVGPGA